MAGFGIQNSYMVPWAPDMFGGIQGAMNLQMNQSIADVQARSQMWNVPTFGYGFNSYPDAPMTGLEGLLNPAYTWNQVNWNAATGNGFGGFNGAAGAFGGNMGNFGFNGMTSPFSSPFSSTWGGSSSTSGSSSSDPDTRKYNKLLSILKRMNEFANSSDPVANTFLTSDKKARLNELATSGSKEKEMKDKYKELKLFFDGISKEDKQKFLVYGSVNLSINGKDSGAKLYEELVNSGFEYGDTAVDKADLAGNVNAKLKAVSESDFNIAAVLDDVKNYKALDFLSSYYSKYKAGGADDIIELFFKAVDKAPAEGKDCVKADFKVLIQELINQSKSVADAMGDPGKKEIYQLADELDKAYSSFDQAKIRTYFKKLYVAARVAAAKNIELSLKEAYGEVDSALFGYNSFISKDLEKDLKNEGLATQYSEMKSRIKGGSTSSSSSSSASSSSEESASTTDWSYLDDIDDTFELCQRLRKGGILEKDKVAEITYDGASHAVWKEQGAERYFIINNKKLIEVTKNGNSYTVDPEALSYKPSELAKTHETSAAKKSNSKGKWKSSIAEKYLTSSHTCLTSEDGTGDKMIEDSGSTVMEKSLGYFDKNVVTKLAEAAKEMGYDDETVQQAVDTMKSYMKACFKSIGTFDKNVGTGDRTDGYDPVAKGDTGVQYTNYVNEEDEESIGATSAVQITAYEGRINSWENMTEGVVSETGLYVGIDCNGTDIYYIYVDNDKMMRKFKEILQSASNNN